MIRVNRSTFAKLCLLTALAVPIQRSAFATIVAQGAEIDTTQKLIAQNSETGAEPTDTKTTDTKTTEHTPIAASLERELTAATDANGLAIIKNAVGETVADPLTKTDGPVTALAFSDDETLFVNASQGRQGLWGLDRLPPSSVVIADAEAPIDSAADTAEVAVEGRPWWIWLIPLIGIPGLAWLLLGRRRPQPDVPEARRQTLPTATVQPPTTDIENDREVSGRAQTIVLTDRGVDESRSELSSTSISETEALPLHESTDLESSPDLEGTNLDLSLAPVALDHEVLDGIELESTGISADEALDSELEADLETDLWDDELELTLDDEPSTETSVELAEAILTSSLDQEPTESPAIETPAVETSIVDTPSVAAQSLEAPTLEAPTISVSRKALAATETPLTEAPAAIPTPSPIESPSGIDAIEPTRDMVIAEIETVPDIEPNRETIISDSTVIFDGGLAATTDIATAQALSDTAVTKEAEVLPSTSNREILPLTIEELASVDNGLADLPEGYGESRIVLLPRDPEWAYAYWDVSNEHKEKLRQQGGQRLMLRLYDVTDLDITSQAPHSMRQIDCHEMARSWYLEMPASDRDYITEIGYLTADDRWLLLARSAPIRVPPVYPSDWVKDQFVSIDWQEQLVGRSFGDLGQPYSLDTTGPSQGGNATDLPKIYDNLFALTQSQEALRVAGSLYGSMQPSAPGALSPSGGVVGLERLMGPLGLTASGLTMSGLTMSGIGSGGSELPGRSRKFWLVADAELIVYGATEPDATLTIGDKVVPLNPDGTFRFHVAFPDGQIDYPIRAVAADDEQTRAVRLRFERETSERNTNTKDEAEDEWF